MIPESSVLSIFVLNPYLSCSSDISSQSCSSSSIKEAPLSICLQRLPGAVLIHSTSYLEVSELESLGLVSQMFKRLVDTPYLWSARAKDQGISVELQAQVRNKTSFFMMRDILLKGAIETLAAERIDLVVRGEDNPLFDHPNTKALVKHFLQYVRLGGDPSQTIRQHQGELHGRFELAQEKETLSIFEFMYHIAALSGAESFWIRNYYQYKAIIERVEWRDLEECLKKTVEVPSFNWKKLNSRLLWQPYLDVLNCKILSTYSGVIADLDSDGSLLSESCRESSYQSFQLILQTKTEIVEAIPCFQKAMLTSLRRALLYQKEQTVEERRKRRQIMDELQTAAINVVTQEILRSHPKFTPKFAALSAEYYGSNLLAELNSYIAKVMTYQSFDNSPSLMVLENAPDQAINYRNPTGESLLQLARRSNNGELVDKLLSLGAVE